jgi:hypothetical protein
MNATAVPGSDSSPSTLDFNQDVGPEMSKALEEVRKLITVRHNGWPAGHEIEISFEDKFVPKDGPSAAVACALLVDALVSGTDIDPELAVTGDLNADGSVQRVGGVADKLRGAVARKCRLAGIPKKTEIQAVDAVLLEGPALLWKIQVISLETFDQALAIATAQREAGMQEALTTFATVQEVLQGKEANAAGLLRNPKVQERLQKVVAAMPNHLSARTLLAVGRGTLPTRLSLAGSVSEIQKRTGSVLRTIKEGKPEGLQPDELASAVSSLGKIRPILDPRLWKYADAIQDFGTTVRSVRNQKFRTATEQQKAFTRIMEKAHAADALFEKMRSDKAFMEELEAP